MAYVVIGCMWPMALHAADDNKKSRSKVVKITSLKVEGRLSKPQAFYVLPRSGLNYQWERWERAGLEKVVQSAQQVPWR